MGAVAGFQLCDSKCVVVIDKTNQSRSDGAAATVTGTFHVTFKGPRKTFSNAVVVGRSAPTGWGARSRYLRRAAPRQNARTHSSSYRRVSAESRLSRQGRPSALSGEAQGPFGSAFQLHEDDVCIRSPYVLTRMDFRRPARAPVPFPERLPERHRQPSAGAGSQRALATRCRVSMWFRLRSRRASVVQNSNPVVLEHRSRTDATVVRRAFVLSVPEWWPSRSGFIADGNRMATVARRQQKWPTNTAARGAGGGNRTRDSCLEGKGITTMQRPRHCGHLRGSAANPYDRE